MKRRVRCRTKTSLLEYRPQIWEQSSSRPGRDVSEPNYCTDWICGTESNTKALFHAFNDQLHGKTTWSRAFFSIKIPPDSGDAASDLMRHDCSRSLTLHLQKCARLKVGWPIVASIYPAPILPLLYNFAQLDFQVYFDLKGFCTLSVFFFFLIQHNLCTVLQEETVQNSM